MCFFPCKNFERKQPVNERSTGPEVLSNIKATRARVMKAPLRVSCNSEFNITDVHPEYLGWKDPIFGRWGSSETTLGAIYNMMITVYYRIENSNNTKHWRNIYSKRSLF